MTIWLCIVNFHVWHCSFVRIFFPKRYTNKIRNIYCQETINQSACLHQHHGVCTWSSNLDRIRIKFYSHELIQLDFRCVFCFAPVSILFGVQSVW